MPKIIFILATISAYSILLPLASGFYWMLKRKDRSLSIFFIYTVLMVVAQFIMLFLAQNRINNIWVVHLFLPVEFLCLSAQLLRWERNEFYKRHWISVSALMLVLIIVDQAQDINRYGGLGLLLESMILFTLSLWSLYFLINSKDFEKILIAAGILTYFGTNSIICLFFNDPLLMAPIIIQTTVNIIANIIYSMGFLYAVKRK